MVFAMFLDGFASETRLVLSLPGLLGPDVRLKRLPDWLGGQKVLEPVTVAVALLCGLVALSFALRIWLRVGFRLSFRPFAAVFPSFLADVRRSCWVFGHFQAVRGMKRQVRRLGCLFPLLHLALHTWAAMRLAYSELLEKPLLTYTAAGVRATYGVGVSYK